ncbi:major facilitator superfamily domain-containing protein [Flammula alnicola]|nr:major facilitator superfamily domain-containing protein [Flammula alnicola]
MSAHSHENLSAPPLALALETEDISGASTPTVAEHESHRRPVELTDQTNLLPFKKIIACFFGLALCMVVSTLDTVIIATAIPTISSAFNAGSVVSWVPSAYLLTSTSFQPLYGRLSDIFGRKAAITVAMLIFMLGNLLAGFSKTIIQLIVFRGIAGAGGGGIISMSQIVISDIVSLRDRGKYQGIIGAVVALGYAIGPVIGGALAQKVSWRWCFWVTIPVSMCAVAAVVFILPLKPVAGNMKRKLLTVDFLGAILTLVGCTLVILPLIWGGVTFPWKSAVVLAPLFSGLLVVLLLCIWEWKGARLPIIPMYIFKHVTVTGVYITMFVNGFVYFSTLYYLPQYFQVVLGYGPIGAAIFLIPVLVSQMLLSWISGVIVSRTGRYRVPKTFQTTTVAAQASVSRRDMSVVTAFRNFIRLFGGTLALAVGAAIINNSLRATMHDLSLSSFIISSIINDPSQLASPSALNISATTASTILNKGYTSGFRTVFILNAALNAVATIASIVMIKHKELTRGDEEELRQEARLHLKTKQESPEKDVEKALAAASANGKMQPVPSQVDEKSEKKDEEVKNKV